MEMEQTIVKKKHVSKTKKIGVKYLLLSLPFVIAVAAFSYVPLFGWVYAFLDYQIGLKITQMPFVGFANFMKLFDQRDEVLNVLRNTLVMSMLNIVASPLAVIFAIMLNEIRGSKFKRLVQTATTLPNFISWIVVYGLAYAMFSSTGLMSSILSALHLPVSSTGILGNNDWAWIFQLCLATWKGLGWGAIIYIAAIAGIDSELYDAARVDGANRFQSILHVTVPGLVPTYLVLLLLNVSNLLNNGFDQYFVFYNSLVADHLEVLDYYVYKIGILVNDYSFSVAIGMLKTFISIILLFTVNWISKRLRGESLV